MAPDASFRLTATHYGSEPSELEADFEIYARADRWRRAALAFLPFFGLALVILPIPAVHLSAPILLFFAFWLGIRRLRQPYRLERLEGPCPACRESRPFSVASALPATLRCAACGEFVTVAAPEEGVE